jgi:hypothetical protein
MGASLVYLNQPNKEIEHEVGNNDYISYTAANMQGWRLNMVSNSTRSSCFCLTNAQVKHSLKFNILFLT